jgi:hypothetical protein
MIVAATLLATFAPAVKLVARMTPVMATLRPRQRVLVALIAEDGSLRTVPVTARGIGGS